MHGVEQLMIILPLVTSISPAPTEGRDEMHRQPAAISLLANVQEVS
jgi:hypothetical protein